jgi:hypothetical protein
MVGIQSAGDPGQPQARLTIRHSEERVASAVTGVEVTRPGVVATTRVTLGLAAGGPPIWEREFSLRVKPEQHVDGTSVVLGPTARLYWSEFFVPVATWQSSAALRAPIELGKRAVAVDGAGDRVVVLFEDGDFQLLELADPQEPVVLAEYRRPKDFKHWSGVRILSGGVALFGEDGLEIVRFGPEGAKADRVFGRGEIGGVAALEPLGENLILGGNRGLVLVGPGEDPPLVILRRAVLGLASVGDALVFTDGESLFVSTPALLRDKRVLSQLKLGRDLGPRRIRAFGSSVVVLGEGGSLVLDLADPRKPQVVSQLPADHAGRIEDVARVRGRLFLLGERGVQLLDASGRRLGESIDVDARQRVATMGRHVVAVGGKTLQVLDATPFTSRALPASPAGSGSSPSEAALD